jgi:mannose-6-phosphate isomerase-like protein (cupin superfamily)
MGYSILQPEELRWDERSNLDGQPSRWTVDITAAAGLTQSRARLWRLAAHSHGRRHRELAQEEVFVVLSGRLTMLLGDPPERVALEADGVVSVEPGTAIQLRNESDGEVVVFAYGAPPISGQAELLDDLDL